VGARSCGLELRLLGGFTFTHRGAAIVLTSRSERLLAFLALRDGVPRDTVAFRLWPDASEERAHACLRSTLWRLPKPGGTSVVSGSAGRLHLSRAVIIDLHRLRALVAGWAPATPPPDAIRRRALHADLLPFWYDDWLLIERESHRQLRLHTLERLSLWHSAQAAYSEAIEAALQAVAGDPLRESAHRCLVRAHLAEGNLSEAIRQTRTYLNLLAEAGLPARLSPQMEQLTVDYGGWLVGSGPRSSGRQ
jgi:DNA-binding SARP family transcriptional activator